MQTVVAVVLSLSEVEGATRVVHEAQDLADFRRGHSLAVEHVVLEATAISRRKKVHHAAPMATCETPRQHVFDVTSVGRRSSPWACNSVDCGTVSSFSLQIERGRRPSGESGASGSEPLAPDSPLCLRPH